MAAERKLLHEELAEEHQESTLRRDCIRGAVKESIRRAAAVVQQEKVDDSTGEAEDYAYNHACDDASRAILALIGEDGE